jgi:hypothetical protein
MDQFKGVSKRSTSARTGFNQSQQQEAESTRSPGKAELRVSYGVITDVALDTSQVKVLVFNGFNRNQDIMLGASKPGGDGIFVPLAQPLHIIHHMFGALRKGLCVRIFWRGIHAPGSESQIEVISDEAKPNFRSGTKEQEINQKDTRPYKIFSGGLSF